MSEDDDNNKAFADRVFNSGMDGVLRALNDDQVAAIDELIKARAPQIIGAQESLWRLAHAITRTAAERAFKQANDGCAEAVAKILTHGRTA